jgi:hypothetical protein
MIILYVLAGVALALNVFGRVLILRKDQQMPDGWIRPLKLVPGADLLYCMFRWEKARLGCVICALSLVGAIPIAHRLLVEHMGGEYARYLAPLSGGTANVQVQKADPAHLQKLLTVKERNVTELGKYLQLWFNKLSEQQGFLCDEMPEELDAYNRSAAAYQGLLQAWKGNQAEVEKIRARL